MLGAGAAVQNEQKNHLTPDQRRIVFVEHLCGSSDGKLRKGDLSRVAQQMGCGWKTVPRLWNKYEGQRAAGVGDPDITSNCKNYGRKGIDVEDLRQTLKDIPIRLKEPQQPERPCS